MAGEVDALFYFIYYVAVFFFLLIVGLATYFTIKYRVRESEPPRPAAEPLHNPVLEVTWIVIPTLIVVAVFFWGFSGFMKMSVVPAEAMQIKVTGQKWFWSFDYPEGASTVNELVAPVGKPVKLLLSSKDVIHSFFVPSFRVKRDVLPNRYTIAWFEATQTGVFDLFCTEYCGSKHSQMIGKVRIVSENEYLKWIEDASDLGKGLTPVEYGAKLYQAKACITCHTVDGAPSNGPSFKGMFGHTVKLANGTEVTVDENYVRESILNPAAKVVAGYQPIMPTFQGILKDKELDALVAYLQSLGER
jgi:cytochrome c oxidase subunit 2